MKDKMHDASGSDWQTVLLAELERQLSAGTRALECGATEHLSVLPTSGVHLAIMNEPFFGYMLEGRKLHESRFSVHRIAPFGTVDNGDVVALKGVGSPVSAACRVVAVGYFDLRQTPISRIQETFAERLCVTDPMFWEARANSRYATVMTIDLVTRIEPVPITKLDRRGWVTLRQSTRQVAPTLAGFAEGRLA